MLLYAFIISVIGKLIDIDRWLFLRINQDAANPFFDALLPYMREPVIWAPLYLFLLVFVIGNFRTSGLWWCLFFICLVAITDLVSARVFKENIDRLRPCYDPDFAAHVRLMIKSCTASNSFTSNHAANHTGMAVFFFLSFRSYFGKKTAWIFLWPLAISFAQVYVGVHYPGDVMGGALLGILVALGIYRLYHRMFGFSIFGAEQPAA